MNEQEQTNHIGMYTNFLTREGILFTAREYYPDIKKIRAVPCYYAHPEGERKSALLGKSFKQAVDEFGDIWLGKVKPNYLTNTPLGQAILVPISDVSIFLDPFNNKKAKKEVSKTEFQSVVDTLKNIGIPEEDIGIYGSYLSGLYHKDSDLDIVIRGLDNMAHIKKNMDVIRRALGAFGNLDSKRELRTIEKYKKEYNSKYNDFKEMIARRWSTIRIGDKYKLKLMFNYKDGEKPLNLIPNRFDQEISMGGVVVDDIGTCFMPRHFTIQNKQGNFKVITYFYNFYFAVKNGDIVNIFGKLSEDKSTILINDRRMHGIKFKNGS